MRFLVMWLIRAPLIIGSTVVLGSVSVAISFFDPEKLWSDRIARFWAKLLLIFGGVRVRVRGMEHLQPNQHYVFAGNHLSLYDTPVVLANIPHRFLFLVSAKYVAMPFLGTHLRRTGHFSVDSDDIRASLKVMTEAAKRIEEKGLSVLLFPEGMRSKGELQEFKEGAAYIAIKSQTPVVPFALKGTAEVMPVGSWNIYGGEVEMVLSAPIETRGMTLKDRGALTNLMRSRVVELLEENRAQRVPA